MVDATPLWFLKKVEADRGTNFPMDAGNVITKRDTKVNGDDGRREELR